MKRMMTELAMRSCTSKYCSKEHRAVEERNKEYLPELLRIRDALRVNKENSKMTVGELKRMAAQLQAITKKMAQSKENDTYGRCILQHCESQLRDMMRLVEEDQKAKCASGSKHACARQKLIANVLKKETINVSDRDRVFDAFAVAPQKTTPKKPRASVQKKTAS